MAAKAVKKGLAACVQLNGPIQSVYKWKGKIETAHEWRLTFKVANTRFMALEAWLLKTHPYEVPEWIAVDAERVSEAYQKWATKP